MGAGAGNATARTRERLPLHPHYLLRDLRLPLAARRRARILAPRAPSPVSAIAEAARSLDALRTRWLNPPEWTRTETLEFPGSIDGPWQCYVHDADERGIGTVRWPRLVPRDAECAAKLKVRTLTNLYNQRPAWLVLAHEALDAAVFAAYGWDPAMPDEQLLEALLALNLERAGSS